jgi:uncharacterized membrane protein YhaH (DUF805 family)
MRFFAKLFSFHGRSTRRMFWLSQFLDLLLVIAAMAAVIAIAYVADPRMFEKDEKANVSGAGPAVLILGLMVVGIASNVMQFAGMVKRCHDRNVSGWYSFLTFIPIFGIFWYIIALGFLPGTRGPNQYGPDPRNRAPLTPPGSIADTAQFLELRTLAENGLITPAEYERRRKVLLGA